MWPCSKFSLFSVCVDTERAFAGQRHDTPRGASTRCSRLQDRLGADVQSVKETLACHPCPCFYRLPEGWEFMQGLRRRQRLCGLLRLKPLSLKPAPHALLWVPATLRLAVPWPLQRGKAQVGRAAVAMEHHLLLASGRRHTVQFHVQHRAREVTSRERAGTSSAWVNSGAPPPASIPLAGAPAGAWGGSSSRVYEEPAPTFTSDDVRDPSHPAQLATAVAQPQSVGEQRARRRLRSQR